MASQNPSETERVEQLTVLTQRLSEIIDTEIAMLQERRPRDIMPLEEEKTRLAKIYGAEITRLRKDPRLTRDVPRRAKDSLKQATLRFHELTARQQSMLLAMKTVSERMIRDIATELARMKAPEVTYGRSATFSGGRPAPFALNRTA